MPEHVRLFCYALGSTPDAGLTASSPQPASPAQQEILDRIHIRPRAYTMSEAALAQRRTASSSPEKARAMLDNRNAWKTGEHAQGFVRQLFRPCLSTCPQYPCELIDDGETALGSVCLDKAEFVKGLNTFQKAQRAAIMKALKDFLGWYEPGADGSTIAWYYGQAYSLGLIQAANLMGKERPLLDIIKNKEIFGELAANGFDLVKNNATSAITDRIIPAMEQGMADGVNPRDVAGTLDRLFDDKNDDWKRLARTEMAAAAERAKLDEWEERAWTCQEPSRFRSIHAAGAAPRSRTTGTGASAQSSRPRRTRVRGV